MPVHVQTAADLGQFVYRCCCYQRSAVTQALRYFTCWALLWHGAVACSVVPSHGIFIATVVAIAGSYITHVHPQCLRVVVCGDTYIIEHQALVVVDALTHQLPLLLLLFLSKKRRTHRDWDGMFFLLYLISVDIQMQYDLRFRDQCTIALLVCAAFTMRLF